NLSVICTYRPKASITELMRITKFQKDELQHLYRSFKQVNDNFTNVYDPPKTKQKKIFYRFLATKNNR
ncbi:unnamed protein product, partial [Didymodactylos carnosus]